MKTEALNLVQAIKAIPTEVIPKWKVLEAINETLSAPAVEKRAPVQGYPGGIPWAIHLEAYEVYCKRWGPQPALIDLEGRSCRGGFSTGELDDFIPGWRDRVSEFGKLKAEVKQLRAQLAAELQAEPVQAQGVPADHLPTKEHIRELAQEAADQVMEQAQVFASAWALVGGRFDNGNALEDAEEAKTELRTLVRSLADLAAETVRPAAAPQAEPCRRLSPFNAVAESMKLASLMGGSIALSDVEMTEHYEQRLRSHLEEFIYPPVLPIAPQEEPQPSYRQDYPTSEKVLGAENEKARQDERLFGVGFTVNGWHVPAHLVSKCGKPQAPTAEAEPQPEREPFTADVECVTDESGTDYSVAVRGPGIRNPLYSDVWLKKERQAAMLAKWLNESVFPIMAGVGTKPARV